MSIYSMTAKAYGRTFESRFTVEPETTIEQVWQRMTVAYQSIQRHAQYCPERVGGSDMEDLKEITLGMVA